MNNLIKINNKWWNNGDETTYNDIPFCDGYTLGDIRNENKTYDMDLLKKLNKFVITTDSQEGGDNKERINIIPEFAEFVHESRGITLDSMKGNYIIETGYVPYLECVTTRERAYQIYEKNPDIGIYLLEKNGFNKMNKIMKDIHQKHKQKFKLNYVALTYHKVRHQVYDEYNHIWSNWIVPTAFSKIVYGQFVNSKIYPDDAVLLFFIGNGEINSMFEKILNVFL